MRLHVLCRSLLWCGSFVVAGAALCGSAAAAPAAAADDVAIHPYLDDGTFLVMRVDLDRVEPAALEKLMTDMADARVQTAGIPEDAKKEMKERMAQDVEKTKTWVTDMNAAGGKRMYVLVDQADQNGPGGG